MLVYGNKLETPWHGIDVSQHQGVIDWDSLIKEQQIDFAIIRTGWGTQGVDTQYKENIKECIRLGIPFGLYHYSYIGDGANKFSGKEREDLLKDQALSEAIHFLELIEPYEFYLDLPVFMDIEDGDGKYLSTLSNKELNMVVSTFCNYIAHKGYLTGIYASKYWLDAKLNYIDLANGYDDVRGIYDVWVAEWTGANDGKQHTDTSSYNNVHFLWQYTSNKLTNCVTGTKRLDCNICYLDYPKVLSTNGLNGRWSEGFTDLIKQAPNNRWLEIKEGNYNTKYMTGSEEPFWLFKKANGGLAKGWVASGSKWYFTMPDVGIMVTGLQQIDGDYYYLDYQTGAMASNCWLDTINGIRYARPNGKFARNIPGEPFMKWRINGKDLMFDPSGDIYNDDSLLSQCVWAPECQGMNGEVINIVCDPNPIKVVKPEIEEPETVYICNYFYQLGDDEKQLHKTFTFKKGDIITLDNLTFNGFEYVKLNIFGYDRENDEWLVINIEKDDNGNYIMPDMDVEFDLIFKKIEVQPEPENYHGKYYYVLEDGVEKHLHKSFIYKQGDVFNLVAPTFDGLTPKRLETYGYNKETKLFERMNIPLNDKKEFVLPDTDVEFVLFYKAVEPPIEPVEPDKPDPEPTVPETPNQSNKWVVGVITAILAFGIWLLAKLFG